MRDYLLLAIILGSVPVCVVNPYFGVLMWTWIAYFNPQRFTWGIGYNFPVAEVVAIPTLLGLLFCRKLSRVLFLRETLLLFLFWAWCGFTLLWAAQTPDFAAHIPSGKEQLLTVSKILLMTTTTILLVTSKKRLKYLFLVTAFSFGILAIKGAVFGYTTGGVFRVWGPPDSFIADNNDFALALNMSLPMLFFLAWDEEKRLLRNAMRVAFFCGVVSVVLTYSRGGLLGLATVIGVITLKARRKVLATVSLLFGAFLLLSFTPLQWAQRMDMLLERKLDASAQQRLISWGFALNLTKDYPVTGGGFQVFDNDLVYQRYEPEPLPGGFLSSGPHSIYFQVLGEQGYVGLAIFLALIGNCMFTLHKLRRRARRNLAIAWIVPYSNAVEVGLLAYMVSGAFLGRAYFDLFYELVACTIALKALYRRELAEVSLSAEEQVLPEVSEVAAV